MMANAVCWVVKIDVAQKYYSKLRCNFSTDHQVYDKNKNKDLATKGDLQGMNSCLIGYQTWL